MNRRRLNLIGLGTLILISMQEMGSNSPRSVKDLLSARKIYLKSFLEVLVVLEVVLVDRLAHQVDLILVGSRLKTYLEVLDLVSSLHSVHHSSNPVPLMMVRI